MSISKSRRQIIGNDQPAELWLCFCNLQHDCKAGVLLDLLSVHRLAVERVGQALNLEAPGDRSLRRQRRAANGYHCLDLILALIGNTQWFLQVASSKGAKQRARHRLAADVERQLAAILCHRVSRQ